MNKEDLMKKYQSGEFSDSDQKLLEKFIQEGTIEIEELEDLWKLSNSVEAIHVEVPTQEMRANFYRMMSQESSNRSKLNVWNRIWAIVGQSSESSLLPRLAFMVLFILVGMGLNYLMSDNIGYKQELQSINEEVRSMKELMVLTMIEKPSTTERLKAIRLTSDVGNPNIEIIEALFKTLNNDRNVNVRLASLDALSNLGDNPEIRMGLVEAIKYQESPIVIVEMASLMVALQEKSAVEEFQKLIEGDDIDEDVKNSVDELIGQII